MVIVSINFVSAQTLTTVGNNLPVGIRNVNPDPNGEPWLVGSMKVTPEVEEKIASIPEWQIPRGLSKITTDVTLPDHVYNHQNSEFPQTFSQIGNCCSAASGIGYCYTYEANLINGTAATSADNVCAYGFIYDFLDNGKDEGCWYYDAWDIAKKTGCLSKADFGGVVEDGTKGMNQTKWGNGYQQYHNAYATCRDSSYYIIKVGDAAGLTKLKRWMFDHGCGNKKGGVAVFSWFASHTFSKIPSGMPDAGKKIVTSVSGQEVTEHAMTFAGYDDRIGPSNNELGALLLQNSWGNSFGDQGRCWVPYRYLSSSDGIWNKQVYVIEVRQHTVKLDYKVTITHNKRNLLQIKIGYADGTNATAPTKSSLIGGGKYLGAFNYCGGSYPLEGNGGSSTIEIGLDATDFYEAMSGSDATFFLIVTSKGGTGSIGSFSLMDYSVESTPREIPCSQTNVNLTNGTTTLSIPYSKYQVAIQSHLSSPLPEKEIAVLNQSGRYSLYIPFNGESSVTIKDLHGRIFRQFCTHERGWFPLPRTMAAGTYVTSIVNNGRHIHDKLTIAR